MVDVLITRILVQEVSKRVLHDLSHAVLLGDTAMVLYGEDHWVPKREGGREGGREGEREGGRFG